VAGADPGHRGVVRGVGAEGKLGWYQTSPARPGDDLLQDRWS